MKQKLKRKRTNSSGTIIKTILQQELKKIESNIDNRFDVFEKKVDTKFDAFETKIDFKLDNLEIRVDEKARQYRDDILISNDKLAKTLETMREDLEIGDFQTREKLENHEKRIKILELA